MELRVLKYYLTLCNVGSITAAADVLKITQPALSKQLMELEKEVGQKLFERGSRKITLTEAGEFLRKRAQEIVTLSERTLVDIPKANEDVTGELRIACSESRAIPLVVQAVNQLVQRHPGIRFHFYHGNSRDVLTNWMESGMVDYALFSVLPFIKQYSHLKLPVQDTWGLLFRSDSPLADKPFVEPDDIKALPLITGRSESFRSLISGWLGYDFHYLNIVGTSFLRSITEQMVADGLACSIVKEEQHVLPPELCFKPLFPEVKSNIYLVWENQHTDSKVKKLFLEELKAVASLHI